MLEKTGGKLGPVVGIPPIRKPTPTANKRLDYVINVVISVNDTAKAKPKVFAKGWPSRTGLYGVADPENSPQLLAYMTGL